MTTHIPYPKIYSLDKEETEGLLSEPVIIQEKIDGANLSIWYDQTTDSIFVGSRTQIVGTNLIKEGFRWAVEYVNAHTGIKELLQNHPTYRLYGEWLVKHTINYPQEYYNKFYLFDILTPDGWLPTQLTIDLAKHYNIHHPHTFHEWIATLDTIKEYAGKSVLGNITGEWVVIKRDDFINKFGDRRHGKYVIESFKEKNNIVFGNTTSESVEIEFVVKTITQPRLMKLINKIEQNDNVKISKKQTGQILGMMWYDIFTEELWNFIKKNHTQSFDFKKAETASQARTKVLFFDYLESTII